MKTFKMMNHEGKRVALLTEAELRQVRELLNLAVIPFTDREALSFAVSISEKVEESIYDCMTGVR